MNRNQFAASITVFFTLLVLPVMALFLVVLKAASSHIEQNDCIRMTLTAGNALLTCYDGELAQRYGLYGADQGILERYAGAFVRENERIPSEEIRMTPAYLLNADPLWTGFFRYSAETVDLQTKEMLSDPEVLSGQIREFMKYRLLEEGFDTLLKACLKIKEISSGTGIEGLFSVLQERLSDYGAKYQELRDCLYPDGDTRYYVTITKKDGYAPRKLKEVLDGLDGRQTDRFRFQEIRILKRWGDAADGLAETNRDACEILEEMGTMLSKIRDAAQAVKEEAAKLPSEEQETERVKDILKQIEEMEAGLWGTHGELEEYRKSCSGNTDAVAKVNERLLRILEAIECMENISEEDLKAAQTAAEELASVYRDDFTVPQTGNTRFSIRDLKKIWNWIVDWKVDLKKYGPDKSVIPDQEAEIAYLTEKESLMEAMEELGRQSSIWESSYEKFAIAEYCIGMFRSLEDQILQEDGKNAVNLRREPFSDGLLRNETEFILNGSYNEYRNLKAVRFRILAIRLVTNMIFLSTNQTRNTKILQAAAQTGGVIAAGAGTKIAYGAILTLWSAAEAYVDYNVLAMGGRIPLIKTDDTWYTDLDAILTMNKKNLLEKAREDTGLDYEDYLRILFLFGDRDKELFRIRDLIERNLQKSGNKEFSFAGCAASFRLETEISGRTGTYMTGEVFSYE